MKQNKNEKDNRKKQENKKAKESKTKDNKEYLKPNHQTVEDSITNIKQLYTEYCFQIKNLHLKPYENEFQIISDFTANMMFKDLDGIINNLGAYKQVGIHNFICNKANQLYKWNCEDLKINDVQAIKMIMALASYTKLLKPVYQYKYIPQLYFDIVKNGLMNEKYLNGIQEKVEGYNLMNCFVGFNALGLSKIAFFDKKLYQECKKFLKTINTDVDNYLASVGLIKLNKKNQYELTNDGIDKSIFIFCATMDKHLASKFYNMVDGNIMKQGAKHAKKVLSKQNFAYNFKAGWLNAVKYIFFAFGNTVDEDDKKDNHLVQMSKADSKYFKGSFGLNVLAQLSNVYLYRAVSNGHMYYEHKEHHTGTSPMAYVEIMLSVFDYYIHDGEKTLSKPLLKLLSQLHSKPLNKRAYKIYGDINKVFNFDNNFDNDTDNN